MLKYSIKRLISVIPVTLGVMLIIFFFQSISPDDPVTQILDAGAPEEAREALREELGLNDPTLIQFGRYVWNFVTKGDLGTSYQSSKPITHELMIRFPVTIKLALGAVILGVIIGMPLGILSAVKQYTPIDSAILAFSVLSASMPPFWLALMLIFQFAVKLRWVPTSGIINPKGWILPVIVVALVTMSTIIRITRSSMLEAIRQDYVRTARAKGQKESVITIRHVLRNSLIPVSSAIGNSIGHLLGGALIVEAVFGIPGIGKYAVDAISARNYPSVLGSVVILAITFTILNLIIDLIYTIIDPRIKSSLLTPVKRKSKSKKSSGRVSQWLK